MRNLRDLRAACEQRVAGIEIPKPFDIGQFCQNVAEHRGRPIELCEVPNMAGEIELCFDLSGRIKCDVRT